MLEVYVRLRVGDLERLEVEILQAPSSLFFISYIIMLRKWEIRATP